MSDTVKPDDLEWAAARAVWSKAGVEISDNRSSENEHFLSELKLAVASFREMEQVTTADRQREWSMEYGAKLCGDLSSFVSSIDDVALPRIERGSSPSFDSSMIPLLIQLAELEHAFRRAPEAPTVRRHKHELNDPLVIRLADSFKRHSGRNASVTTDWDTSARKGVFVNFVTAFVEHFLPDQQGQVNPRSIQRALQKQRDWPTHPHAD